MSDHHHEKQQQPQHPPLHPNIHIQAPTPSLLPAYKRLITSLLPIPYPPQFYTASLPPFSDSFALLAIWQSDPSPTSSSSSSTPCSTSTSTTSRLSSQQEQKQQQQQQQQTGVVVIGGIQARIEHHSSSPVEGRNNNNVNGGGGGSSSSSSGSSSGSGVGTESTTNPPKKILYIQTLAVLAPYRGLGVGSKLLEELIEMVLKKGEEEEEENEGEKKKNLVEEVYAHVWEVNEEGVEWYLKRGFVVVGGLVERYYRRLRPQGARLLRRRVGVGDWVRMKKGARGEGG